MKNGTFVALSARQCYHISMIIRPVALEEREAFNRVARHPLQSWEWGEFRRATGVEVERLAQFDDAGRLTDVFQMTFHRIPVLGGKAGYLPKGPAPTREVLASLKEIGHRQRALFVKLEPNVQVPADQPDEVFADMRAIFAEQDAVVGQSLFTPYTFVLDLAPDEAALLANCKSKTRYNIRLAEKHGVQIVEDTSETGLEDYLRLLSETTTRQGFYAHGPAYFRTMWNSMGGSPMFHIFKALYQGKVISAWIVFIFNGVGYYPYGASSREHRDVMANNLMMWEVLRFAKAQGCTSFDMWGSLGPQPNEKHPWYGFHRFKEGYGATLMKSVGTYDLVVNPPLYQLFTLGNRLRWQFLRFRATLGV